MDKQKLYDEMAARKSAPKDFNTYIGDNGRVNRCAELIKQGKLKTGGNLLDVGGGIGDLGHAVRDLYGETWIVDISRKNLEAASSKGNWTGCSDIDSQGIIKTLLIEPRQTGASQGKYISESSVGLVTALDFIEHIIDPENFARECFRVLESGGEVFINTPNIEFFKHIESQLYDGIFPHTSGDKEVYHGGHLSFYNLHDMVTIFASAGFTGFEQIKDEEGYQDPPTWILDRRIPKSQAEYQSHCMRLGNPNLLFKCVKP